jgi:hypothetical protein
MKFLKHFFISKESHLPQFENGRCEQESNERLLTAKILLEAGKEAIAFENCLKGSSRVMTDTKQEECLRHYTRFVILYSRVQPQTTPKFHLMFHQILEIPCKGNPIYYHSYNDEAFNGLVAKVAKSCHRSTWHEMVFTKCHVSQTLKRRRLH